MRTTYPEAVYRFEDVTALEDSTVISVTAKEFSNTALFSRQTEQPIYGTMELNQFVLDGSRTIFPTEDPEDIAFWSDERSDENGLFTANPIIYINFTEAHSSIGLTLHFAEDIPGEIEVRWYTLSGTKLDSKSFYPDGKNFFCKNYVKNYGRVEIEFISTSFPYRYAKMDYIEYGMIWLLGRDKIKSASVYEELDVTSASLSINTAKISMVDKEGEFDTANQEGLWRYLQKEQELKLVEYVNKEPVDCGTFYLDTYSSSKNIVDLSLIDLIGIMDKTKFYNGQIYEGVKAGLIIDDIMASCGISKYTVSQEVYDTLLSGWIGIQSHRAALQQVAFACGAVADCSRSDMVRIYMPGRHISHAIGLANKFQGTKITISDYVSSVSVEAVRYLLESEAGQISSSVIPAGITKVEFNTPYKADSITASSGTILEAGTNYVIIEMDETAECSLTGRKYSEEKVTYTASVGQIEAGERERVKSYKGCTLMSLSAAKRTAQKLLEYHQLRQEAEMRCISNGEGVGNWCLVELAGGGQAVTGILNQDIDLTGGFLSTMKCKGYNRIVTGDYYAGEELYTGTEGVI